MACQGHCHWNMRVRCESQGSMKRLRAWRGPESLPPTTFMTSVIFEDGLGHHHTHALRRQSRMIVCSQAMLEKERFKSIVVSEWPAQSNRWWWGTRDMIGMEHNCNELQRVGQNMNMMSFSTTERISAKSQSITLPTKSEEIKHPKPSTTPTATEPQQCKAPAAATTRHSRAKSSQWTGRPFPSGFPNGLTISYLLIFSTRYHSSPSEPSSIHYINFLLFSIIMMAWIASLT